jgi:hypothetical protein
MGGQVRVKGVDSSSWTQPQSGNSEAGGIGSTRCVAHRFIFPLLFVIYIVIDNNEAIISIIFELEFGRCLLFVFINMSVLNVLLFLCSGRVRIIGGVVVFLLLLIVYRSVQCCCRDRFWCSKQAPALAPTLFSHNETAPTAPSSSVCDDGNCDAGENDDDDASCRNTSSLPVLKKGCLYRPLHVIHDGVYDVSDIELGRVEGVGATHVFRSGMDVDCSVAGRFVSQSRSLTGAGAGAADGAASARHSWKKTAETSSAPHAKPPPPPLSRLPPQKFVSSHLPRELELVDSVAASSSSSSSSSEQAGPVRVAASAVRSGFPPDCRTDSGDEGGSDADAALRTARMQAESHEDDEGDGGSGVVCRTCSSVSVSMENVYGNSSPQIATLKKRSEIVKC